MSRIGKAPIPVPSGVTITLKDGNTVTVATGAAGATHTLQPGDVVTIAGAGNAGYNGTWTVTSVPSCSSRTRAISRGACRHERAGSSRLRRVPGD